MLTLQVPGCQLKPCARAMFVRYSTNTGRIDAVARSGRADDGCHGVCNASPALHTNFKGSLACLRACRSVAASYSHTQVQSVMDTVRVAESMREGAAAGQPMDAMAALEAEANASMSADAAAAEKSGSACVKKLS